MSYRTHARQIELDNLNQQEYKLRDISKTKYYNCNEPGHISNTCSKPKKVRTNYLRRQLNIIITKEKGNREEAIYKDKYKNPDLILFRKNIAKREGIPRNLLHNIIRETKKEVVL
jgi:hypothetical protein